MFGLMHEKEIKEAGEFMKIFILSRFLAGDKICEKLLTVLFLR
jgi:hypothetical protein